MGTVDDAVGPSQAAGRPHPPTALPDARNAEATTTKPARHCEQRGACNVRDQNASRSSQPLTDSGLAPRRRRANVSAHIKMVECHCGGPCGHPRDDHRRDVVSIREFACPRTAARVEVGYEPALRRRAHPVGGPGGPVIVQAVSAAAPGRQPHRPLAAIHAEVPPDEAGHRHRPMPGPSVGWRRRGSSRR